ncbi:serine/threonine-protein kinase [Coleofasciculus chthonoplastes]|nr:serine/threonine-protein kinase [Coleofasciculus chthonoplastes]
MTKDPNHGRILANRYQLVGLIGQGAMGQVYKAKDMLLGGVIVAVKFISQTLLNQKMRDRFEREATICALLGEKSNHIVRVRDYGVDENDISFYVMEFLEGNSLSEIIREQSLPLPRFLNISRQISLGLQCAHKGIVIEGEQSPIIHRDIKPSNILVVQDASFGELVKILDFGIAKLIQSNSEQTHSFMGTSQELLATLWVMLTKDDIENRRISTRYNQFLFLMSPHPMVLWITALHNRQHGARWLTCYLDLKTAMGQKVIRILGESGNYRILFFALTEPQRCANVMTATIASTQRKLLLDWANASHAAMPSTQPQLSKRILKQELEKLKPKIVMKLEAVHTDYPTDISG